MPSVIMHSWAAWLGLVVYSEAGSTGEEALIKSLLRWSRWRCTGWMSSAIKQSREALGVCGDCCLPSVDPRMTQVRLQCWHLSCISKASLAPLALSKSCRVLDVNIFLLRQAAKETFRSNKMKASREAILLIHKKSQKAPVSFSFDICFCDFCCCLWLENVCQRLAKIHERWYVTGSWSNLDNMQIRDISKTGRMLALKDRSLTPLV